MNKDTSRMNTEKDLAKLIEEINNAEQLLAILDKNNSRVVLPSIFLNGLKGGEVI